MCTNQKTAESYQNQDRTESEEGCGANSISVTEGEVRTVHYDLVDKVVSRSNLETALKQVRANRGAPGVDGMTVDELVPWLETNYSELAETVRNGRYKPKPVRRKEIPKPDGGVRNLGIPSVIDRLLQQAVSQVLMPIYEPTFSETSYGFRPRRSAHDAIQKAKQYYSEGYGYVVDLDLAKFFDTLNQDYLMNILRERIKDKALIELIKRFLRSGVALPDGLLKETREGSPQGGPLSPLLSNIYLDRFDKLLESRGLRFVRYADDCMIFVRTPRSGERVRESVTRYLEGTLKLKVNQEKTVVGRADSVKFLGFRLYRNQIFGIAVHKNSLKRCRKEVRRITKRNRGMRLDSILNELKTFLRGWMGYFGLGLSKSRARDLDSWIRQRIRQYIFKQWKTPHNRAHNLITLCPSYLAVVPGYVPDFWKDCCWKVAYNRSYWKAVTYSCVVQGLSNEYLAHLGVYSLSEQLEKRNKGV